jgi:hypothetical protein
MTPLISLAAQKRHLSLYVFAVVDGVYLAESRADRLGSVSCGKSCIRFTSLDEIGTDELAAVLRAAHDRAYDLDAMGAAGRAWVVATVPVHGCETPICAHAAMGIRSSWSART